MESMGNGLGLMYFNYSNYQGMASLLQGILTCLFSTEYWN
jgi:hypothetical protein